MIYNELLTLQIKSHLSLERVKSVAKSKILLN
jgi:hypothetical protein